MTELIIDEMKESMEKAIQSFEKSLQKIRTGRASLALLDGIKVDYYGVATPLNQVATLSVPESRLIVISPWDTSLVSAIEKAIQKSELGLTPSNDGKVVRIVIPPLTEERRKELAKIVKKMAEETRIKLRNFRRNANEQLKEAKKKGELAEDDMFQMQEKVQKMTDEFMEKVDAVLAAKEKEIMEI